MLKVSMSCSRCGKVVERETDDVEQTIKHYIQEEEFTYIFVGGVNRLTCEECRSEYVDFQNNLEKELEDKYCDFFDAECKEKDDERDTRGTADE